MSNTFVRASRTERISGPGYVDACQIASPFGLVGLPHGPEYLTHLSGRSGGRPLFACVTQLVSTFPILLMPKNSFAFDTCVIDEVRYEKADKVAICR